ncbi:SMP-30/gluconolactonase/LRE family protein [Microbacterium sp. NPDC089189]|uniref:SMP-30/gluconolactonase/LRE family protein n=1 Tax=Microbacterium sp. NPDC089189 TaxID=3154972 RepID=UPI003442FF6A
MAADPRVFRAVRSVLVESIFWDARTEELAWVDITAGTFHRGRLDGDPDGSDDRVVALPAPVSAVQPSTGDGYVAALKDTVVLLDADGVITGTVAAVPHRHGGIRFNEGKVDPFGRFVVGAMNTTSDAPDAALYSFGADGSVRVLRGGFGVANGMEWSDDGREMFVTDTATRTVYRGAYGPQAEALGALEPYLRGRMSDGLVRADDGSFWNGLYGDGEVVQWSADGEIAQTLSVPAPNVTSVAFGGPGRDTLFVGTAREQLREEDLVSAPLSGAIFAFTGLGSGRPVHTFGAPATAR